MTIDKDKILENIQKYVLKGQSKKAIKECLKLLELSPKDKRFHLKLGDLYLKDGDSESAINEYLKVADLYAEEDLNLRSISIFKRILAINPRHIEALHKIAQLYLKEGLRGSAKSCYQNILKIKPDDQEARRCLKMLEADEGTRPGPKPSAPLEPHGPKVHPAEPPSSDLVAPPLESEASGLDKDAEMHYHLGIAYKEMELFDYAISEFEAAASNSSIRFDCYIMLGECYMEKGNHEKSIEYYKKATEMEGLTNDKLARLHYHLGLAYEASGRKSEALSAFNLVLKMDRSLVEAQDKIKKLQKLN